MATISDFLKKSSLASHPTLQLEGLSIEKAIEKVQKLMVATKVEETAFFFHKDEFILPIIPNYKEYEGRVIENNLATDDVNNSLVASVHRLAMTASISLGLVPNPTELLQSQQKFMQDTKSVWSSAIDDE